MPLFKKSKQTKSKPDRSQQNHQTNQMPSPSPLSDRLDQNLHKLREQTGNSRDIIIRTLQHSFGSDHTIAVIYIDGLVDTLTINNSIMQSLTPKDYHEKLHTSDPTEILSMIKNRFLSIGSISDLNDLGQLISAVLEGNTVILIDGSCHGIMASSTGGEERGVEEPQSQTVVRGPKEGKVAILVDGTPFALLAPITIFKLFQSSEDYYQKFDIATFLRLLRIISFVVSMLLPSLYIAISTFHQEMLPTTLLISLAAQREGIPFPAVVEALAMEITFEVLREAGVRMPRAMASAISIVGALVLGQAAVQAGLVSAAMVIIVAFTAIASFVAPSVSISNSARLLRFGFMILAATLGLFGIMAGLIAMLIHLCGFTFIRLAIPCPVRSIYPARPKRRVGSCSMVGHAGKTELNQ